MDTQKDKSVEAYLLEAGVMSANGGMSIGGYPSLQFYGVQQLFMELRASNIPFEADDFASKWQKDMTSSNSRCTKQVSHPFVTNGICSLVSKMS